MALKFFEKGRQRRRQSPENDDEDSRDIEKEVVKTAKKYLNDRTLEAVESWDGDKKKEFLRRDAYYQQRKRKKPNDNPLQDLVMRLRKILENSEDNGLPSETADRTRKKTKDGKSKSVEPDDPLDVIKQLSVALRTEPLPSLDDFFGYNGFDWLIKFMDRLYDTCPRGQSAFCVCLGCLNSICNTDNGSIRILDDKYALDSIARGLVEENENRTKKQAANVLQKVHRLPAGYPPVLDAIRRVTKGDPRALTLAMQSMEKSSTTSQSRIQAVDEVIRIKLEVLREAHHKMESVNQREKIKIDDLKEKQNDAERSFNEKKLVIDVSGATSAGKSTVINALVRRDLLFTAAEHCTPCSVSIETSPDINEPFVTIGKPSECSEELSIDRLKALSDAKSDQQSEEPLYVCLPQDTQDEGVFRVPNLRLVDTPGLYEDVDEKSVDIEGDAFVFVVDFDTGVDWNALQKKLRQKNGRVHSWKAVFFAYNRCDLVEKFNKERFEKGKREKLAKAVTFLKDNGVYSDDSSAKAKVFFLSAYAAGMARQYRASAQVLLKRIANCRSQANTTVLLVRGGSEAGKTTLCDDLCGIRRQSADDPLVEKRSVTELGNDETGGASTDAQQKSIAVVDSPSEDEVQKWIASDTLQCTVLAVVIDCKKSLKKIQQIFEKQLSLCAGNTCTREVFLIITKLNEMKEAKGKEKAVKLEKEIREHWKALGRSESNLFFMEKDEVMEKYETAFSDFETQVVEAAHENFADIKLRRIEDMAEELKKCTLKKVNGKLTKLKEMQCAIRNVSDYLSAEHEDEVLKQRRSTRAIRFLDKSQVDTLKVSESHSVLVGALTKFAEFCRKEVDEDFQKVINKVTEHLRQIDSEIEERMKSRLQRRLQPEGSIFDVEGMMQRLQSLIPEKKYEKDKRNLEKLKEEKETLKETESTLASKEVELETALELLTENIEDAEQKKGKLAKDLTKKTNERARTEGEVEKQEQKVKDDKRELRIAKEKKSELQQNDTANEGITGWDVAGLVGDVALAAIPGGVGALGKAAKGVKAGVSAIVIGTAAASASEAAKLVDKKDTKTRQLLAEKEKEVSELKQDWEKSAQAESDNKSRLERIRDEEDRLDRERDAIHVQVAQDKRHLRKAKEEWTKVSDERKKTTAKLDKTSNLIKATKKRLEEERKEYEEKKEEFLRTFPRELKKECDRIAKNILAELITASRRFAEEENSPLREKQRQFEEILAEIEVL